MFNNTHILAIIPARGGSKGILRKNLRLVAGLPLVVHSILAAKASRLIERTIVSTDDEEIAEVARSYGAEVPFLRPADLALDTTPDFPVFEHCLNWLEESEEYRPDIVVHLRPTGPLRTGLEIDEAVELLERHPEADSVRSVHEPDKSPYKMWRLEGSYMVPFLRDPDYPEHYNAPRQLLPKVYATNANIGVVRYRTLREKGSVIGERVLPYPVSGPHVDIDTELYLELAELLFRKRAREGRGY